MSLIQRTGRFTDVPLETPKLHYLPMQLSDHQSGQITRFPQNTANKHLSSLVLTGHDQPSTPPIHASFEFNQSFVWHNPVVTGDNPHLPNRSNHTTRSIDSFYGSATYGGAHGVSREVAVANAKLVQEIAKNMGVDPVTAVATMLVESHGNPKAVGDNGASIGLFQLNKYGEGEYMSKEQKEDPWINTRTALSYFSKPRVHHGRKDTPGEVAAKAQRPKDPDGFAVLVNLMLPEARALLRE